MYIQIIYAEQKEVARVQLQYGQPEKNYATDWIVLSYINVIYY